VAVLALGLVGGAIALAASLSVTSRQLTVYRTCVVTAATSSSSAVLDSWVDQRNATTKHDVSALLNVASEKNRNARAYLKFDLTRCGPSIPSTATVHSATLRLYVYVLPTVCRTHDLFTVTGNWLETSITWSAGGGGAAGQPPPATAVADTPASVTRKSSITVGTPATCGNNAQGFVSGWDVTSDVQAFTAGTLTNRGWMIRDDVEGATAAATAQYVGKSGNAVAAAPQLVVTYST
jgi:hypothetical protein